MQSASGTLCRASMVAALAALLLVGSAGCNGDDDDGGGGGPSADTGAGTDVGPDGVDAGPDGTDAGPEGVDAAGADLAPPEDAGPGAPDEGLDEDGGQPPSDGGDPTDGGDPADAGPRLAVAVVEPAAGDQLSGETSFAAQVTGGDADSVAFGFPAAPGAGCQAAAPGDDGLFRCTWDVSELSSGAYELVAEATAGGSSFTSEPVEVLVLGEAPAGTRLQPGALQPPEGLAPAGFVVGTTHGVDEGVGDDGGFVVPVQQEGVTVAVAIPADGPPDATNHLLAVVARAPGEAPADDEPPLAVDAHTTALALVFLHPFFASDDPHVALRLQEIVAPLPEVEALAQAVAATYPETPHPLSEQEFVQVYLTALRRAVDLVPGDSLPGRGGPVGNARADAFVHLDSIRQLSPRWRDDGRLRIRSEIGMPLDSLINITEVDPRALHQLAPGEPQAFERVADVRQLRNQIAANPPFYPTFTMVADGDRQGGLVPARSIFRYLELADMIAERATTFLQNELGLASATAGDIFELSDQRPGLYLVRGYSGRLTSGLDRGELEFVWDEEPVRHVAAVILNLVWAVVDGVSVIIDVSTFAGPCVQGVMVTINDAVDERDLRQGDLSDVVWTAFDVGYDALASCIAETLKQQAQDGIAGVVQALGNVAGTLGRSMDVVGKVGKAGKAADRIFTLIGLPGVAGTGLGATPLETVLVVVGDPFSPVVTEVQHPGGRTALEDIRPGTRPLVEPEDALVLHGERFEADRDDGTVGLRFTDSNGQRATVRAQVVSPSELRATVPEGLAGALILQLRHPGDGFELGSTLVIRPRIEGLRPAALFNADPFALEGEGLAMRYDLTLSPGRHRFEPQADGSTDRALRYVAAAPAGRYDVQLDTGLDELGTIDLADDLAILGPALVDELQDPVVGAGLFVLRGHNFGEQAERVDLQLRGATDADGRQVDVRAGELVIYDVGGREGPVDAEQRQQPSYLTAAVGRAAPTSARSLAFRLTTPEGSVDFTLPYGGEPPIEFWRTERVDNMAQLREAAAFVSGDNGQANDNHRYEWQNVAPPERPEDWICVEEWEGPDWLVTPPPGIAADGNDCPFFCMDPELDPVAGGCPTRWGEVAPGRVADNITWWPEEGAGQLEPVTFTARHLTLHLDPASGSGLTVEGVPGTRSELYLDLSVTAPSGGRPVVTLSGVHGGYVDLRIDDGSNCELAVRVEDCQDVDISVTAYGCRRGVEVVRSHGVHVWGTVAHRDVGVLVDGGSEVTVQMEVHAGSGGPNADDNEWQVPGGPAGDTVGVRVQGGAEHVKVDLDRVTHHGTGVLVAQANNVMIAGTFGIARWGAGDQDAHAHFANRIGVDLRGGPGGPATRVQVGGDIPGVRGRAPSVFVHCDVGVRVGAAEQVEIIDGFYGVVPRRDEDLRNARAVQVTADATAVRVAHNHFNSTGPDSVLVESSGGVTVERCLFAGISNGRWDNQLVIVPGATNDHCNRWDSLRPWSYRDSYQDGTHTVGLHVRASRNVNLRRNTFYGAGQACALIEDSQAVRSAGDRVMHCPAGMVLRNVGYSRVAELHASANLGPGLLLDGSAGIELAGLCARANEGYGLEVTGTPRDWDGEVEVFERAPPTPHRTEELQLGPPDPDEPGWRPLRGLAPDADAAQEASVAVLLDNELGGVGVHDGTVDFALRGAVVSGNTGPGLHVFDNNAAVELSDADIGIVWGGAGTPLPPFHRESPNQIGVLVQRSVGRLTLLGNVVAANMEGGVMLDSVVGPAVLQGNFVGVDPDGLAALPNLGPGITVVGSQGVEIGGRGAAQANLVSANLGPGVLVQGPAELIGNYIGVDRDAANALPNAGAGVHVSSCPAAEGGPTLLGNLISGNSGAGVQAERCEAGLRILSNGIGQDGAAQIGFEAGRISNEQYGVVLTDVQGAFVLDNAIVSDADGMDGVRLERSTGAVLSGNRLYGLRGAGVRLTLRSNNNRVLFNELWWNANGVMVELSSVSNRIQGNVITANGGAGIDLRSGGNAGIPAPFVAAITYRERTGSWRVHGTVDRTIADGATVELFADEDDEGRIPLASVPVVGRTSPPRPCCCPPRGWPSWPSTLRSPTATATPRGSAPLSWRHLPDAPRRRPRQEFRCSARCARLSCRDPPELFWWSCPAETAWSWTRPA